jgi:hypothetical protein
MSDTSEYIAAWCEGWVVERDSIIGGDACLLMPDVSFVQMKPGAMMPVIVQTMHEGHPWLHLTLPTD